MSLANSTISNTCIATRERRARVPTSLPLTAWNSSPSRFFAALERSISSPKSIRARTCSPCRASGPSPHAPLESAQWLGADAEGRCGNVSRWVAPHSAPAPGASAEGAVGRSRTAAPSTCIQPGWAGWQIWSPTHSSSPQENEQQWHVALAIESPARRIRLETASPATSCTPACALLSGAYSWDSYINKPPPFRAVSRHEGWPVLVSSNKTLCRNCGRGIQQHTTLTLDNSRSRYQM